MSIKKELSESVVIIRNFPENRKKVYEIAQNFLRENGLGKSYRIENTQDTIKFFMKNSKLCIELLKKFQEIKKTNKELLNLDAQMEIIEPTQKDIDKQKKFIEQKIKLKKLNLQKKPNELDDEYRKQTYEHRHLKDISSKAGVVNAQCPYKTQFEIEREQEKLSRKLDIGKKPFKNCPHKNDEPVKLDTVPVGNTEDYKYRNIDKKKWVSKYDFDKY